MASVFVTGSSDGIGRETARLLAQQGMKALTRIFCMPLTGNKHQPLLPSSL